MAGPNPPMDLMKPPFISGTSNRALICLGIAWIRQVWAGNLATIVPVRELRSAANQAGRIRTLSETYGGGGWEMNFEEQKTTGGLAMCAGGKLCEPAPFLLFPEWGPQIRLSALLFLPRTLVGTLQTHGRLHWPCQYGHVCRADN